MRTPLLFLLGTALVFLPSCGGTAPKKTNKSEVPAVKTEALTPPVTVKTEISAPVIKTETPVAKTEPTVATSANPAWGKAHPEEDIDLNGRSIGHWVSELAQKDKTKLLEALEFVKLAGTRATRGLPMLELLSKHEDKEIAELAKEALQSVK